MASYGQSWQKIRTIELGSTPTSSTTDYQGNLFTGFASGRLTKYDPNGKILENFSLSNNSSITLIDVQNNLRPYLFYFDNQQITILDRFSSVPKVYQLSDFNLEIGLMTCPAPDGDFWIVENNPQRLKKVNPLRKVTVLEIQVSIEDSIGRMQAYQNILAISGKKNVFLFDQFGGLLHTLKFDDLTNYQIINDVLYVFTDTEIHKVDPFKGIINSTVQKPANTGIMLKSRDGFLAVNGKYVTYYKSD